MRILFGFLLTAVLAGLASAATAGERVALVFSAQKYEFLRPLDNPNHDAQAVAETLERLGFDVTIEQDRSLKKMRRALDDFRDEAKGAELALVYFAGHGVEISGENRLLPVDADASSLDMLKETSLPLEDVRQAAIAVAPAVLIVLDACRDDPFGESAGGGRSARPLASEVKAVAKPGLGRIGEAENTLFVFSAAPGKTAADGDANNSPFSAALAKYLPTDGLEIRSVLTLVQQEVYDRSRGNQSPWIESAPFPNLFFAAATGPIPERERLLLAMAELTPDLRDEVERVAADADVPLAPLYGALIAADLKSLTLEDRQRKLEESAQAYIATQAELAKLKALASSDPRVTSLREEADQSLAIGAFADAHRKLAEAAAIDKSSGDMLAANTVARRLSEAATYIADAGVARTQLDYPAAIAALERAAARHELIEREDVPDAARADRTWLLADLGDLEVQVGDMAGALDAYQRMQAAARIRMEKAPDQAGAVRDLSASLERAGDVRIAQGELDRALSAYSDALTIHRALASLEADNTEWQRDLSRGCNKVGDVRIAQGDLAGALQAYSQGFDVAKALAERDPTNDTWQRELYVAWVKIGDVKIVQDDRAGALDAYSQSLALVEKLAGRNPENPDLQRDVSVALNKVGDVKLAEKDLAGALEAYSEGLAIREKAAREDPGDERKQRDLTVSWEGIGGVKLAQGDIDGALQAYNASLAIAERLAERDENNAVWQHDLFVSLVEVGDVKLAQHDLAGALQVLERGPAVLERLTARDEANAVWQRDLIAAHIKLAQTGDDPRGHYAKALAVAETMQSKGILVPADAAFPDLLRQELAKWQ